MHYMCNIISTIGFIQMANLTRFFSLPKSLCIDIANKLGNQICPKCPAKATCLNHGADKQGRCLLEQFINMKIDMKLVREIELGKKPLKTPKIVDDGCILK